MPGGGGNVRKSARYRQLEEQIRDSGWVLRTLTIEVGARGFVAHSVRHCLRLLVFSVAWTGRIVKVLSQVSARCSYTLWLALASMLVALVLALPLGIAAALKPGSWLDGLSMTISLLGVSLPNMWLGPMLLLLFSIQLSWFPGPAPDEPSAPAALVLPAIALGTALMAMLSRMTRASLLGVMGEDYIRTARAKGLSAVVVVLSAPWCACSTGAGAVHSRA